MIKAVRDTLELEPTNLQHAEDSVGVFRAPYMDQMANTAVRHPQKGQVAMATQFSARKKRFTLFLSSFSAMMVQSQGAASRQRGTEYLVRFLYMCTRAQKRLADGVSSRICCQGWASASYSRRLSPTLEPHCWATQSKGQN